jgi:hypothetical protein
MQVIAYIPKHVLVDGALTGNRCADDVLHWGVADYLYWNMRQCSTVLIGP